MFETPIKMAEELAISVLAAAKEVRDMAIVFQKVRQSVVRRRTICLCVVHLL